MALRSVLGSFHRAAQAASTTLMVPKEQLARIAGLNQSLHGALGIVSPPLGALLMELLPVHWAISVDVLTALLAVVPLLFIDIPQPTRLTAFNAASPVRALLTDVRAGFRFIWSWPGVRGVILLAMGLNLLLSPTFALLPLLVTQHFQGGAMQLGYMDSAWAIGIVVGGLSLSTWGGFRKRTLTAMLGIIGTGLGVALVGFAPMNLLTLALVSMAFGGICNAFCNGSFNAIMQENIPPAMQGRVITVVGSGCMAMMPLGLAVAGPLADATGVRAIWAATGLMQAVMGLAAMLIPTIMNLESNRPADALAQAD
jgi:DHA3 family macrolide efflux protein-like MFS transporter